MPNLHGDISSNNTLRGSVSPTNMIQGKVNSGIALTGSVSIGNGHAAVIDPNVINKIIEAYLEENSISSSIISTVDLLADKWVGSENLYSQVVSIEGVTPNSQVDLTPDVDQLVVFYEKDLTFVTENDGGVVTVYAIGQKPTNDYTIQVTITEVGV